MEETICKNCLYWGEEGDAPKAPCYCKPYQVELGVPLKKIKNYNDTCKNFTSFLNT